RAESRSAPLPPHVCRCQTCGATAQGRSDLAAPGAHVGERAKLLTVYGRAHLGISLGKTTDLMRELFGLRLSTAAASGHWKWFRKLTGSRRVSCNCSAKPAVKPRC
ncbi:MAG: hypothetical protein AB7U20_19820, partial [Planctomycetaceae bacterium]